MKRVCIHNIIRYLLVLLSCTFCMMGCDVHEFPDNANSENGDNIDNGVNYYVSLRYDTEMTTWYHAYNLFKVDAIEDYTVESTRSKVNYGEMRYIIRAYDAANPNSTDCIREFTFTRPIGDADYNTDFMLKLPYGDYVFHVWSDMVQNPGDNYFYDASNFAGITLTGTHVGTTDYRDAFRGSGSVTREEITVNHSPHYCVIPMKRPLAKYEFISTDFTDFIDKEVTRTRGNVDDYSIEDFKNNIDEYRVEFIYSGYMPNTYNIFSDSPVDAVMGVRFDAKINELNENEASIGFDYVFVNGSESSVSVQVAIYDKYGERISLTNPINVPLKRSHHTILRGSFLMQGASSGIEIVPNFDGDHNVVI